MHTVKEHRNRREQSFTFQSMRFIRLSLTAC